MNALALGLALVAGPIRAQSPAEAGLTLEAAGQDAFDASTARRSATPAADAPALQKPPPPAASAPVPVRVDVPPSYPERDREEAKTRAAGWWGALIGALVGAAIFGGLALGGVLPAFVMIAGVPAFAVLGAAAGLDIGGS
jgi:hypothetical protein